MDKDKSTVDNRQQKTASKSSDGLKIVGKSHTIIDLKKDLIDRPLPLNRDVSDLQDLFVDTVRQQQTERDQDVGFGESVVSLEQSKAKKDSQISQEVIQDTTNVAEMTNQAVQKEYSDEPQINQLTKIKKNDSLGIHGNITQMQSRDLPITESGNDGKGNKAKSIDDFPEIHKAFNLPGSNDHSSIMLKNETFEDVSATDVQKDNINLPGTTNNLHNPTQSIEGHQLADPSQSRQQHNQRLPPSIPISKQKKGTTQGLLSAYATVQQSGSDLIYTPPLDQLHHPQKGKHLLTQDKYRETPMQQSEEQPDSNQKVPTTFDGGRDGGGGNRPPTDSKNSKKNSQVQYDAFISKRSSMDQQNMGLIKQIGHQEPAQKSRFSNQSMLLKSHNGNGKPLHVYNSKQQLSMSNNSYISADMTSVAGMVGAQSKLHQNQNQPNQTMATMPNQSSHMQQVEVNMPVVKNTSEGMRRQKQPVSSHRSQKNIPPLPSQVTHPVKEYNSLQKSVLYGTKMNGRKQFGNMRKSERDEILDEVLKMGRDPIMRQSNSSSALQDTQVTNDLAHDPSRVGMRGVILNEYGQNSASHHFQLNRENSKRSSKKTTEASPRRQIKSKSNKSVGLKAHQGKHGMKRQYQSRDMMNNLKMIGRSEKLRDFGKAYEPPHTGYGSAFHLNQSTQSPMHTEVLVTDLDMQSGDENYQMMGFFQDNAQRQNNLPPFGAHIATQNSENIFLQNVQSNMLKRPTSMPNFHENASKVGGRSNYGPPIKENFKSSEGLQEASDNTTSVGLHQTVSRKRLSQLSKQHGKYNDNTNLHFQLDQQRQKIEYLTKLNEELLRERNFSHINHGDKPLSTQSIPILDHLEPYAATPEEHLTGQDEEYSRNTILGTVNINKFISSTKGTAVPNNQNYAQLDRTGLKTQNGTFYRPGKNGIIDIDPISNEANYRKDSGSHPSQNIRLSIPVYSNIGQNNSTTGAAAGLPRLPIYNSRNNNINVKMAQNHVVYKTNPTPQENLKNKSLLENRIAVDREISDSRVKQFSQKDKFSVDIKGQLLDVKKNLSFSGLKQKVQTIQQSREDEVEKYHRSLEHDGVMSESRTDERKANTTPFSDDDTLKLKHDDEEMPSIAQNDSQQLLEDTGQRAKEPIKEKNNHKKSDTDQNIDQNDLEVQIQEVPHIMDRTAPAQIAIFDNEILQINKSGNKNNEASAIHDEQRFSTSTMLPTNEQSFVSKALQNVRVKLTTGEDKQQNETLGAGSIYGPGQLNSSFNQFGPSSNKHGVNSWANTKTVNPIQMSKLNETNSSFAVNSHPMPTATSHNMRSKRLNQETQSLARLNDDIKKFKEKLEDMEQDNMINQKPLDGMDNLSQFINKVLLPKLGAQSQLIQVLKVLYRQISDKQRNQKSEWELKRSIMENQIDLERKNYEHYKETAKRLQAQIEYDKKGLDRFLKKVGKENVLDQIDEYEKQGPLPVENLLIAQGKLQQNENQVQTANNIFEQSTKYSGLQGDLRIQLQLLRARAGDFLTEEQIEMLSNLQPKNQIDELEQVEKVQNALILCFSSLQATTAKQVLQRCIKRVIQKEQSTQMGVDMFEEERASFRMQIEALNEQINNLTQTTTSLSEINKRLMGDKAEQSRQARDAKGLLERTRLDLSTAQMSYKQLLSSQERSQAKIDEKNQEIHQLMQNIKRLEFRIEGLKNMIDIEKQNLEAKRLKKRKYKEETNNLMDQLDRQDDEASALKEKLNTALTNMANGMVRKLRKIKRPSSARGIQSFKQKRKQEQLKETDLLGQQTTKGTNQSGNQKTQKDIQESAYPQAAQKDIKTQTTQKFNKEAAKDETSNTRSPKSGRDDEVKEFTHTHIKLMDVNVNGMDNSNNNDKLSENGSDFTHESYYVPLEEAYEEVIKEKQKKEKQRQSSQGTTISADGKTGDRLLDLLTDEQYFKMADSLGILDVNEFDGENFTMSKDEALERINNWFKLETSDDEVEDEQKRKTKKILAAELFRRFSKRKSKSVLKRMKTKKAQDISDNTTFGINIDHLTDQQLEQLIKRIEARRLSLFQNQDAKRYSQMDMSPGMLSQMTKSEGQSTDQDEKIKQIFTRHVSPALGVEIGANGKLIMGKLSGNCHFDHQLRPIIDPVTGVPVFYDQEGNVIDIKTPEQQLRDQDDSSDNNTSPIGEEMDSEMKRFKAGSDGLLKRSMTIDEQNWLMKEYNELKKKEEEMLMFNARIIKTIKHDRSCQTAIRSNGFHIIKLQDLHTAQTQTQEEYFPYDDETKQRIANILGNKLQTTSDLYGRLHESQTSKLMPNGSTYQLSVIKKSSSQGASYLWPKLPKRAQSYAPVKLKSRKNDQNQDKSKTIQTEKKSRATSNKSGLGASAIKHEQQNEEMENLPATYVPSPNALSQRRNVWQNRVSSNPYGIQVRDNSPIVDQILQQSLDQSGYEAKYDQASGQDKSGQVSLMGSFRPSNKMTQFDGKDTGRFIDETIQQDLENRHNQHYFNNETVQQIQGALSRHVSLPEVDIGDESPLVSQQVLVPNMQGGRSSERLKENAEKQSTLRNAYDDSSFHDSRRK